MVGVSSDNPFEQQQSEGRSSARSDSPSPTRAEGTRPAYPTIQIPRTPPPAHHRSHSDSPEMQTASTSAGGTGTAPTISEKPTRRVQWPAQLSSHQSVTMASPTSPKTLEDIGARDALHRALAEHEAHPDEARRYIHSNQHSAASSGVSSRAESNDGDHEARMDELRNDMDVFVDPGETDGLPALSGRTGETRNARQAWNLVKAYQTGAYGFMRQRKNAGFTSGLGDNADEEERTRANATSDPEKGNGAAGEDEDEKAEKGVKGFFRKFGNNDEELPPPPPSSGGAGGGGILSALIALQQQQAQAANDTSTVNSAATSPLSSRAPSRRNSLDEEDEDEEVERMKFTMKQRAKRAQRGTWDTASAAVGGVGKSALGGAGYVMGGAANVVGGAANALGFGGHQSRESREAREREHRRSESGSMGRNSPIMNFMASRSTSALPLEPPSPGFSVPRKKKAGVVDSTAQQLKKLGHNLGLEVDTASSRPQAAKSSAGVFGGLMLSTGNIAGIAAPSSTKLAPSASRPGYHLSRYSAPDIRKSSSERPRSWYEGSRPSSRNASRDDLHRPPSFDVSPTSRPGTPPLTSPPLTAGGSGGKTTPGGSSRDKKKNPFALALKDIPTPGASHLKFPFHKPVTPGDGSPRREASGEYFLGHKETQEERERREWEKEKRRRRKLKEKRKQEEVFITMHVAAILARQEFIMKMARSFMMFGAPSHRLEAQIQATARVLEINCQVVYIPGVMLISFGDTATHTSETKFLKQPNGLDLGKLLAAYMVYFKVIHDKVSVTEASVELDRLMVSPPHFKLWQHLIIGGLASAAIQPSAFYGSFIDMLVAIPLGSLLVLVQIVVSRNDLYSSLFEIVIACIISFLAAALASTHHFCFAAVASSSVVLILPGYIVLCGSLELANRSIISGSVRLVYSILYSLFLGFGLAMGGEIYQRITGLEISGGTDFTCSALRINAPWYRQTVPRAAYFLTIPLFLLMLGLRNGQPLWRKETPIMLLIGSAGFAANFYSGKAFVNRSDISSAIGSFVVGFLANVYGKFTRGNAFVVAVVGVLIQLPSGLSNGGLLNFASGENSTTSYSAGFTAAQSLVEVAIGLTVGLFVSAALVNFAGGGRRRGSNLSSF